MVACLCIHGFTGSPAEIKPLTDYLKAHTDWDVLTPTLPGHDKLHQLRNVTYKDWLVFTESILTQLLKEDEEVYIIGFSMGGLLAGWLARHHPEVKKLVLLSTAVNYLDWEQLLKDGRKLIAEVKTGPMKESSVFNRYFGKAKEVPASSTLQFKKMVDLGRPAFEHIDIPTFIAQGGKDMVVPAEKSVAFLEEKIDAPKEIYQMPDAGHLLCLDADNELLFERVLSFLERDFQTVTS
ncbi:alpha/beta hydrolase [Listeria costaricensis]|uniref:alpha/beta hydrolase n=1 Tax=Listeria costaricensis TaxID=2026604 RepID=UPI000C072E61|nr:alpha/beta fold hydrolase [Listeria costaricensis]